MDQDDTRFMQLTDTGFGAGCIIGVLLILLLTGSGIAVMLAAQGPNAIVVVVVVAGVVAAATRISPLINTMVSRASVRLSTRGIVTSGPLLQRTIRWNQITAIEVLTSEEGRVTCVKLLDGGHRELAAPRDVTSHRDPDFDRKLLTIQRWWRAYRQPDPRPRPDPPAPGPRSGATG